MANHFFDYQNWSTSEDAGALSNFGAIGRSLFPANLRSSPNWILFGQGQDNTVLYGPQYSYFLGLGDFYHALVQTTPAQRQAAAQHFFLTMGHVLHHLQDMAQPQHVRNDNHCNPASKYFNDLICAFIGNDISHGFQPSFYEEYVLEHAEDIGEHVISGAPAHLTLPLQTTSSGAGYPQHPGALDWQQDFWYCTFGAPLCNIDYGLAAFTSQNFFSAGTNVVYDLATHGMSHLKAEAQPDPQGPDFQQNGFAVENGDLTLYYTYNVKDYIDGKPDGTPSVTTHPATAASALAMVYGPRGQDGAVFKLTPKIYKDQMETLVPQAMAYSEWFLDYTLRGANLISASIANGKLYITNNSKYEILNSGPTPASFDLWTEDGSGNRTASQTFNTCTPQIYPGQTATCDLVVFADADSNPDGWYWLPQQRPATGSYLLTYFDNYNLLAFATVADPQCTTPGCLEGFTVKEVHTGNCDVLGVSGSSDFTNYHDYYVNETPNSTQVSVPAYYVNTVLNFAVMALAPSAPGSGQLQLPLTLTPQLVSVADSTAQSKVTGTVTLDSGGLSGSVSYQEYVGNSLQCFENVVLSSTQFTQYAGEPIPIIQSQ
jgi:hypothetical protein